MPPLLEVSNLTVCYGAIEAVRGLDLHVQEGEIVALLGPNGAGKSSSMQALVGLVRSQGQIRFGDHPIARASPEARVRAGITLCAEGRRVFAGLTVHENLLLGAATQPAPARQSVLDDMYVLFPTLAAKRGQAAGTLSGGEQQLLAMGRALLCNPRLLLLDEPSLGLAPKIVDAVFEAIGTMAQRGLAILLVEQDVTRALGAASRAYVMAQGKIVHEASAQALQSESDLKSLFFGVAHE